MTHHFPGYLVDLRAHRLDLCPAKCVGEDLPPEQQKEAVGQDADPEKKPVDLSVPTWHPLHPKPGLQVVFDNIHFTSNDKGFLVFSPYFLPLNRGSWVTPIMEVILFRCLLLPGAIPSIQQLRQVLGLQMGITLEHLKCLVPSDGRHLHRIQPLLKEPAGCLVTEVVESQI